MTVGRDLELQGAIVTALKANAELKTLIGNPPRIYQDGERAGEGWPGSYVMVGEGQVIDASNQCLVADQIFPDIHVWSRKQGFEDVKRIAALVRSTLHNAALTLSESRCFSILHDLSQTMRDPDGVTKHVAITFKARVEDAAGPPPSMEPGSSFFAGAGSTYVLSKTRMVPPSSPQTADRYFVPDGATGAWADHAGEIAEWSGDEWIFMSATGFIAVEDEKADGNGVFVVWADGSLVPIVTAP